MANKFDLIFIGKRIIEGVVLVLVLVLILLFWLSASAEALRATIDWKSAISFQRGPVDPKFQVEGVAPTNQSSSQ